MSSNGIIIPTMRYYKAPEAINDHYKRAIAAGAETVIDIDDTDFVGRGYTCRMPERIVWSFGSYNPWVSEK